MLLGPLVDLSTGQTGYCPPLLLVWKICLRYDISAQLSIGWLAQLALIGLSFHMPHVPPLVGSKCSGFKPANPLGAKWGQRATELLCMPRPYPAWSWAQQVFGRNKSLSSFEVCLLTSLMYETRGCSPQSIENSLNDPSRWFCNRFCLRGESHGWWHDGDSAYLVDPSHFISITHQAQMSYFSPTFFLFFFFPLSSISVSPSDSNITRVLVLLHHVPHPVLCSPAPQLWPNVLYFPSNTQILHL